MKCIIYLVSLVWLGVISAQLTDEHKALFEAHNVTITDDTNDPNNFYIFNHNGIPSHDYGPFGTNDNPNSVSEQDHMFQIPKNPSKLQTPECLNMGTIAVAINGVPIFNPYSGPGYNAVEGDNAEVFDACDGHPQNSGVYHYHQIPLCLLEAGENDQLLGVALDGFPIYGPLSGGVNITTADLDDCNGQMRDGSYEYRMTYDFPYVLGCFAGDSTSSSGTPTYGTSRARRQSGPPPQGGGGGGGGMASRCLYVKHCENPALNNCPEAATVWGGSIDSNDNDDTNGDNNDSNDSDRNGDTSVGIMTSHLILVLLSALSLDLIAHIAQA